MIHNCPELMDTIQHMGFLPLLESNIQGFSADSLVAPECRYRVLPDGGWEWPLWKWKGPAVTEGDCVYGKFFDGKAGFVSRRWWPDFCNWHRSIYPAPQSDSVEDTILSVLREGGSQITRQLRAACGFTDPKMRSRFDNYITRLQQACLVVTEDFVYPTDRHGKPYGWGWALLAIPEHLLGHDACHTDHTPEQSRDLMMAHLASILPQATPQQLSRLIGVAK